VDVSYSFVDYGESFDPREGTIVLDVGLKTVPGVIDHHHPQAEPECTASLLANHPGSFSTTFGPIRCAGIMEAERIRIITIAS